MPIALIADIVGSRRIPDREAAQRALDEALARLDRDLPIAVEPLHPIVGDELQGVYPDLEAALSATLLVQLALPDVVQCRFGLGVGAAWTIPSASGGISDGTAWWAARSAIGSAERLARRTAPSVRTQVAASEDEPPETHAAVRLANAFLLARDELVGAMSERTRRLTYGRCMDVTQRELAESEGVTQSAVSQALAASGAAAVIEGFRMLRP